MLESFMTDSPATVTWAYVAGFFDGEGCVHIGPSVRRRCIYLSIVQAQRTDRVLTKIQHFLEKRDIQTTMNYRPKHLANPKWLPVDSLTVCDYRSVRKMLRCMFRYLIVKRPKAIEALARISERPYRRSVMPPELLEKARLAYRGGLSFRMAAAKYHLDASTLRRHMLATGERGRTVSESITAWHRDMSPRKKKHLLYRLRVGSSHRQDRRHP